MNFYTRFTNLCTDRGLDPCSQKAADLFNVTRSTISTWSKKDSAPRGDTVKCIADALGVSSDYLLGRTDDQTDYSNPDLLAEISGPVLEHLNGDVKKAIAFQAAVDADARREIREQRPVILRLYEQLDDIDRIKVEGIIQGLLLQDKYQNDYHTKQKLG